MSDYSVTGDTKLDTSGFTKGISSMTVAAGNLISDLVKTAGSKLAGLAQSSVSVGMTFDESMSQVAATMGKSVDEIDNLTKVAKEMGSTTKFTATQAADALNYLALAGYDADKAAEVLPSVLNLAAAGGMDLAAASNMATKAMASLGIEATKSNLDEFGNKLAVGASRAGATVAQLGESILTVGGTAANLKGGTTELVTALGKLADIGYVGAEGGTHLRNAILSLQSPTDDASKMMEQLGLQVYDAQGNMRGLDEILGDLNAAMQGMTQGQKDSILNQLFNKTDLAAVKGLLAAQGEQWETLAAQIDAADGAMGQMAETQQDNLQGVMTSMGSAFEGLQLAIYNELEPTLTEAGNYGIQCLRQLTTALTEGGPEAMLQAAGEILSDLASGIAEQLPGLMTTGVEIITQLAEDIVAATPAMLASAAEIISALVQALGTALPQLVDTGLDMIAQLGEGLKKGLPEFLAQALPVVADFASGLRENVGQIVDTGIEFILNLAQGLADGLPTLIEQLPGIVSDIAGVINDNAPKILMAGVYLIETLGKGLINAIPTILANIPQICQAIFDVFTAFRWLDIGKYIVDGLWNGITAGWNALVGKVKDLVNLLPKAAKVVLGIHSPSKVFDEIGKFICDGFANGIRENTPEVVDAATDLADEVKNTVYDSFDDFQKAIKDHADTGLLGTFDDLYTAVKNKDWKSIGLWAANAIYGGLTADQKKQVNDFALGLVDKLNEALGNAQTALVQKGIDIGAQLCKGLTSGFGEVWTQAKTLGTQLTGIFQGLKAPLSSAALAISQGLKGGLLSSFPAIYAGVGSMVGTIGAAFEGMMTAIASALNATVFGIPMGVIVAGAAVALGVAIAAICASLGASKKSTPSTGGGSASGGSGSGSISGDIDISTGTGSLEDAITANTKALEKTNAALADMIRQAGTLVLSDNMRLGSTVAASGTARVAAAANNYHREGDTNITQNIYSKAQTAADLQREARWEADRAKAQRR